MEGVEYSAYPRASALVANDKPTIARVALAEPGRPNSRTDEVMVTSEIVEVFGCRHAETIPTLRRPASEKRQGTKSREVGHRRSSECYGNL